MDSNTQLPAIERWWPELTISAKHELQKDLHGEISESVLNEIETLSASTLPKVPLRFNDDERAFIKTQTEIVD
ncbi:hypothetical protein [Rhodoglobus sp.]